MLTVIERDLIKKPKLGGWRNINTGVIYLNAESQTGPPPKRIPLEKTCTRHVQTVFLDEKECQSTYACATQTWRKDLYISNASNKFITSKPYVQHEEHFQDLNSYARIIQRCYRAYKILKFIKECAQIYRKLLAACNKIKDENVQARRERYLADCRALNNPCTLMDYDALVNYLETIAKNKDFPIDSSRCRALKLLEEKRHNFIVADRKMREAREIQEQNARVRFLSRHCRPVSWRDCKGRIVEMLTLRNQAALKYWSLYELLMGKVEESDFECKIAILLEARCFVQNHYCATACIFRNLLDQEIILTARQLDDSNLQFLRKRIIGVFLKFVKTSHNCTCKSVDGKGPESIYDLEFREPLEKNTVFCDGCRKLLPIRKFPVTVRKYNINKCKACERLLRNLRGHVNLKPYLYMLTKIRESELHDGVSKGFADALTPIDLMHLVLDIWHGRSVLSECTDPSELRLVRYKLDEPWSPWNCVLLTEEEAEFHYSLGGGGSIYSEHLSKKIRLAHRTARMDFRGLVAFEGCIELEKIDDRQPETATTTSDVGCDNRCKDLIGCL